MLYVGHQKWIAWLIIGVRTSLVNFLLVWIRRMYKKCPKKFYENYLEVIIELCLQNKNQKCSIYRQPSNICWKCLQHTWETIDTHFQREKSINSWGLYILSCIFIITTWQIGSPVENTLVSWRLDRPLMQFYSSILNL